MYGLDYIMAVRDYRELQQGSFELVPFDFHFDMARAVKSEEELAEVRDSMDIIHEGFWALLDGFAGARPRPRSWRRPSRSSSRAALVRA